MSDDAETRFEVAALQRQLTEAQQENGRLRAEIAAAMAVLQPNMPESGLRDACCQVKQVAISEKGNAEYLERENRTLREALAVELDRWTIDYVLAESASRLDILRTRMAALASPATERTTE